ncbi:DUF1073 domain-containing protein, partial [Candidatus Pacearchaeota archaeon]|nr:DUF1073 domain-containing protein [Candidatus Pacearchaeota archaeon]
MTEKASDLNSYESALGWNEELKTGQLRKEHGMDAEEYFPATREEPGLDLTAKQRFPKEVKDGDLIQIASRDGFGYHMIERLVGDAFNKWAKFSSPEKPEKAEAIIALNGAHKMKLQFKLAYKFAKLLGYSLLVFNLNDSSAGIEDEPVNVKKGPEGLVSVRVVSKDAISKIIYEEDSASDRFGLPKTYKMKVKVGQTTKDWEVPWQRVICWTNWGMSSSVEGMSMFHPMHDDFLCKKNMDYALEEAVWADAATLTTLKLPKGGGLKHKQWADEHFKNINHKSEFAHPDGYEVTRHSSSGGLNPKPHIEYLITRLGSGSRMGKIPLTGDIYGRTTGSEFNWKEYYGYINDEQTEHIEYYMKMTYDYLTELQILPEGEYDINWNPLQERSPEDIAKINKLHSGMLLQISMALTKLQAIGLRVRADEDDLVIPLPDSEHGLVIDIPMKQLAEAELSPDFGLPPDLSLVLTRLLSEAEGRNLNISKGDRIKLFNEWQHPIDDIKATHTGSLISEISKYQIEWLNEFEKVWLKYMQAMDAEGINDDTAKMIEDLIGMTGNTEELQKELRKIVEESYILDGEKLTSLWDLAPDTFKPGLPAASAWFDTQAVVLRNNITSKINSQFIAQIQEGLIAGEGYTAINERLKGISAKYQDGIPKTVHKIVHEAMLKSRADNMEA